MLVLVPLGIRVQALASPQSRRFAEVSLTLRLHTAPPLGFLHTRGHLECGTFGQAVPDPGVMRPRLESLYTSLLLGRGVRRSVYIVPSTVAVHDGRLLLPGRHPPSRDRF